MLMNTDPNHDPQDPNPVIGEDQAGVAPGQASAAPSDQTPEPSTDFVVMVDGQTVESEAGQDSPSSPIGEEPQEVAVIGTDSSVSRSDTPQAGQQSDPSRVDAQPAALHTDSQPGTAETDPQSVAPQSADSPEGYQFGPQRADPAYDASQAGSQFDSQQFEPPQTGPQFDASQAGSHQAVGPQFTPLPGAVPVGVQPQPEVPQFGAQPPASQFGGPQGGQNPIPGGQAYPAPAPYPAPNPYMAQNPYAGQFPQMAPPIQQDSGKASGLAIASLILAILFWPIGLMVSIISVCLSSGRENRTSRILSLVALGISLLVFLFNVIIFVVVFHSTVDFFENHIPDLIDQSYSQTADDNGQDDGEDRESGLRYSEHAAIDPICDLTNGLEFIA